jgi:hypothetical protein
MAIFKEGQIKKIKVLMVEKVCKFARSKMNSGLPRGTGAHCFQVAQVVLPMKVNGEVAQMVRAQDS